MKYLSSKKQILKQTNEGFLLKLFKVLKLNKRVVTNL